MVVCSVELSPPRASTVGGVRKLLSEPVLALITEGERVGSTLFCDWVVTHPGLVPGAYELVNGMTVVIPPGLCSLEGKAAQGVTLEVQT